MQLSDSQQVNQCPKPSEQGWSPRKTDIWSLSLCAPGSVASFLPQQLASQRFFPFSYQGLLSKTIKSTRYNFTYYQSVLHRHAKITMRMSFFSFSQLNIGEGKSRYTVFPSRFHGKCKCVCIGKSTVHFCSRTRQSRPLGTPAFSFTLAFSSVPFSDSHAPRIKFIPLNCNPKCLPGVFLPKYVLCNFIKIKSKLRTCAQQLLTQCLALILSV